MDLERLSAALEPRETIRRAPVEVRGLAYDVRAVEAGSLFFCVPGMHADGHDFAPEAARRGAAERVSGGLQAFTADSQNYPVTTIIPLDS